MVRGVSLSISIGDLLWKKSYPQLAMMTLALGVTFSVAYLTIAKRESSIAFRQPTSALLSLCPTTRDFGSTTIREKLNASFPIRNAGTRRLVLNAMDLNCGCSQPGQRTILVAIGETIHIDVPLDTRFTSGSVENSVSFTTNDPAHPHFELKVRAFVTEDKQTTTQ